MASELLERKTMNLALKFKSNGRYPAAVVGAEKSNIKRVSQSCPVCPSILVNSLRNRLGALGELYSKANGNMVGCCAEVNAANSVLTCRSYLKPNEIKFSKALRPRTMQVVPMCKNCQKTFNY